MERKEMDSEITPSLPPTTGSDLHTCLQHRSPTQVPHTVYSGPHSVAGFIPSHSHPSLHTRTHARTHAHTHTHSTTPATLVPCRGNRSSYATIHIDAAWTIEYCCRSSNREVLALLALWTIQN